jgi:hypothetical protein
MELRHPGHLRRGAACRGLMPGDDAPTIAPSDAPAQGAEAAAGPVFRGCLRWPTTPAQLTASWERTLWWASHPLLLPFVIFIVAARYGRYDEGDIGHKQTIPLFLQGSTDMGGSDVFAATVALYVACGLLGAIRLSLYLNILPPSMGLADRLRVGARRLIFHWIFFVVGGTMNWTYDSYIGPNDFRNIFLLVALIYILSALWITCLSRIPLPRIVRLLLAPALIFTWLVIGADGNTAKAGQVLNSGIDPIVAPRSPRHALMLHWHALCDTYLGDIGPSRPTSLF